MRVIARKALKRFWEQHPDAESPLRLWYSQASKADWKTPADIRADYRSASILLNNRVVFNIKGNHYRLVVFVLFRRSTIYIRFIGTHQEYDQIDAATI